MFKMMKNSPPNRFIWAHIFKKAPTSEGGTSPLRHPPAPFKRNGRRLRAILDFWKSAPPHFENRSAAYACHIHQHLQVKSVGLCEPINPNYQKSYKILHARGVGQSA